MFKKYSQLRATDGKNPTNNTSMEILGKQANKQVIVNNFLYIE